MKGNLVAIIRTVLGDRNPKELGAILPHEHTLMRLLGAEADHYSSYDREQAIELAAKEIRIAMGILWYLQLGRCRSRRPRKRYGVSSRNLPA